MLKSFIFFGLFAVVFGGLTELGQTAGNDNVTTDPWRSVDDYLGKEEIDSLDAEKFIPAISQRLRQLTGEVSSLAGRSDKDRAEIEVLETLKRFMRAVNSEPYTAATHSLRRRLLTETADDKYPHGISKVVLYLAHIIAQKCLYEFMVKYRERRKTTIRDSGFMRIQEFFREIVYHQVTSLDRKYDAFQSENKYFRLAGQKRARLMIYSYFIKENYAGYNSKTTAEIAYDSIESAVINRQDSQIVDEHITLINGIKAIYPDAAKQLFMGLIYQPCLSYVSLFGRDVFELAETDLENDLFQELFESHVQSPVVCSEYLYAWAQYRGCLLLTKNAEELEKLLENLGQVADTKVKFLETGRTPYLDPNEPTFLVGASKMAMQSLDHRKLIKLVEDSNLEEADRKFKEKNSSQ